MAEKKISGLTAKGSNLENTDLFIISKSDGSGGYDTKSITGAELTQVTLNNQTGTAYTLVLTDANKLVEGNNGSAINLTVPPNSGVAFPIGSQVVICQQGAGQITLVPGSGVTLRSRGAALKLNGQYAVATIIKRATDEWYCAGDLTT